MFVRWNPYRGWWVDNGFGVNALQEFHDTREAAVRAGQSALKHPLGRVLVAVGTDWYPAATANPLQSALPHSMRATRPRSSRASG